MLYLLEQFVVAGCGREDQVCTPLEYFHLLKGFDLLFSVSNYKMLSIMAFKFKFVCISVLAKWVT